MRVSWPVVLAAALVPAIAAAAPGDRPVDFVEVPPAAPSSLFHAGPAVIYLNRCTTGCTASAGGDDAVANTSSILGRQGIPASVSLAPFMFDDATWDGVVQCVRTTYAIYNVSVVTEPPTGPHVEVMVAGTADALALPANTLGIAPLTNNCSRIPSAIAFAFANSHQPGADLVLDLCATAAHEAGHTFGLDHEFDCRDPMTYLVGCGQKTFINRDVVCGEFDNPRPCKCGAKQSSYEHLIDVIGPGAEPAPDMVTIVAPAPGTQVPDGFSVFAMVGPRPAANLELWANGTKLAETPGKTSTSPYELRTNASVFDGFLDLEVRVYDDLGLRGVGAVTVQKGAACTDASTCPAGYGCDRGRCFAPAASGQVGDACQQDTDCAGGQCAVRDGQQVCSQPCWPFGAACPASLSCLQGDDQGYACFSDDSGGCCSTGGGDPRTAALGVLVVGLLLRRRRA